jgi:hypothetical protein
MKAIYAGALLVRKVWPSGKAFADRLQFWAEEALRLATYSGYLVLRPFLRRKYEAALSGAELLLVVRKRKST